MLFVVGKRRTMVESDDNAAKKIMRPGILQKKHVKSWKQVL